MSARAQTLIIRLALFAATCAVISHASAGARINAFTQRADPVPAAQVAQAVEQARGASLTDEAFARSLALGYRLFGERRHAEAAQLFGALAAARARDPAAAYGAALATFNLGRTAEAETLARRAVEVSLPTGANARTGGQSARDGGNMRAADSLVLLAVVLAVKGDNAEALKTVERAVALAPEHFDAQLALGRALYGAGDDARAARAFRAAVALRPGDARARFFLATALERAGDAQGALAAYRELASSQPLVAEGHLGLGVLLTKRGGADAEEGFKELERALALNPNLYEARVAMGRALVAAGRAAEAVEHLRRAAELAPGNPEPHYQLSLAYRRMGRSEDAAAESAIVKRIHESRRAPDARGKVAP
jgi:tetratricopeptide (TPR) repeat protein